jgi:hypothetical protein
MSFSDIFKGKFLSQVGSISALEALVTLAIAIGLGLVIFFVYKKTFSGVMYSGSFNMSLLLMVVITAVIIMTISSNVVLSLGMVGALSIIRFRTVIKDPVDIMYLFWAISMGIIVGAHQYVFALICVAVIAALCVVMSFLKKKDKMYLVIVRYRRGSSANVEKALKSVGGKIRNKAVSKAGIETIAEVGTKVADSDFVEKLLSINGVVSAVLVNYNGEYAE